MIIASSTLSNKTRYSLISGLFLIGSVIFFPSSTIAQAFNPIQAPTQSTLYLSPEAATLPDILPGDEYYDDKPLTFDTEEGYAMIKTVERGISDLQKKILELDKEIGQGNPGYEQIRRDVVSVIDEIIESKNALSETLEKIHLVERVVIQGGQRIEEIRGTLDQTKQTIATLTTTMYQLSHRMYDREGNLDDVKLFLNTDGDISETVAQNNSITLMLSSLEDLITKMTTHQSQQARRIRVSNDNKRKMKEEVENFGKKIANLEQKRKHLIEYLELYRVNRDRMGDRAINIFDTRKDVHDKIVAAIEEIKTKKYVTLFSFPEKMKELTERTSYAEYERSAELSRPLMPVSSVSRRFKDSDFMDQYGFHLYGIEVPAAQQTPLYASDDGLVYRTVVDSGLGVSWILLVHKGGYMTVYQFPSIVLVEAGDLVRRGQLIGYSGGEPGTQGAGFISKRPNLTFMVVHNFQFVDPLNHLDLSIFPSENNLAIEYKIKFLKDLYRRPRDLYKTEFMPGASLNERRQNFLDLYGVGIYRSLAFWMDASAQTNIDLDLGICIGFAESTLGNYLSTSNNIGNVGNNDRGDRVAFGSALDGGRLIYSTLNNQYLGHYNTIIELNGYGNKKGSIYASSPYNRQNNVVKCLSMIKGYYVPDDFPFRTGPNPNRSPDAIKK